MSAEAWVVVALCLAAALGLPMLLAAWIAVLRRRSAWAGVALGLLLSWLGVLGALFLPAGRPPARRRR